MTFTRLSILSLLLACGGATDEDTSEPTTATTGGEAEPTEPVAAMPERFDDMTREQKLTFMRETVMPEMTALFQELDGERFADFGCADCHGEDMQEVDFAMPNGVAPLTHEQIPAIFESDQPMAVFMTQRAWPRMAELLGEDLYDPETHEGFSCFNCHATAEGS